MIVQNLIDLNTTSQTPSAVYSQTITKSIGMNIPKFMESSFSTAVIAFEENKDDNDSQYEWVIEFTCGGLDLFFPDGFVGINMYSRTLSKNNLAQMIDVAKELNLSWVLDQGFHQPTHNQTTCMYNTSDSKDEKETGKVTDTMKKYGMLRI